MAVLVLLEHLGADDVGRHQVRRELDPGERQVDDLRQGLQQHGLADAGDAFEEHVALGEQARDDGADQFTLADDDLADLGLDLGGRFGVLLGGEIHGSLSFCCGLIRGSGAGRSSR